MVIQASSTKHIDALIADLSSERPAIRDAAVARLTVIGSRAVDRLIAAAGDRAAPTWSRTAALKVLEAIGDLRSLDSALKLIDEIEPSLSAAAISVARVFLRGRRGVAAVDRLTEIALDRRRAPSVRVAAVVALGDLKSAALKPVFAALGSDPNAEISDLARHRGRLPREPGTTLKPMIEGSLSDDPAALRQAISQEATGLPLPLIGRLIERIRDREQSERPSRRAEWLAARASAHAVLARRGSRLALYDLRETLEGARGPLPVEFLTAVVAIGDTACLESLAVAYSKAPPGDDWWRRHLVEAFQTIAKRERLSRRHAVIKKIEKRWPKIFGG